MIAFTIGAWILRQICRLRGHDWRMHGHEFSLVGSPAKGWPPIYVCGRCGREGQAASTDRGPDVEIRPV